MTEQMYVNDEGAALAHLVTYDDPTAVEVEADEDGEPRVQNHDELAKHDVVRGVDPDDVTEYLLPEDLIAPGDSMWKPEYDDMSIGDEQRI